MSRALQAAQLPLVGREHELRALRAQLGEAAAGRGSLVLISGEAGIGKSTLVSRIGHEAVAAGAQLLTGHCYDHNETPPYGPWFESFARFGDETRGQPASTILPPRLATATSQADFFGQVQTFCAALAAECPLVLLLEDLHWADAVSLELLRHLARALPTLPILFLATYRADELDRHHPLHTLLPLLVREAPAVRLELRPLDISAVRALIDTRYALPEREASLLIGYLIARTNGNALFVSELLRTLEEERLLQREHGGWHLGTLAQAPVPRLLKQVIDARLARFSNEAVALLAVAAVIGQDVPLATWEAVTLADEEALIALAEGAAAANFLTAWDNGAGVRFSHALIRDALYESIPAFRRRRLHRRVGEVLAALPISGYPPVNPDTVAQHFQRAGDPRAAEWLTRAGEAAEDDYAWRPLRSATRLPLPCWTRGRGTRANAAGCVCSPLRRASTSSPTAPFAGWRRRRSWPPLRLLLAYSLVRRPCAGCCCAIAASFVPGWLNSSPQPMRPISSHRATAPGVAVSSRSTGWPIAAR